MNKRDFLKSDWFLGIVIALIVAVAARGDQIQSLERKAYDLGVNAVSRTPSDKIAVIAIDEQSISNIGRWPWPRDVHARMTNTLAAAQAKVIVNSAFFFEPQVDPRLVYINKLLDLNSKSVPQTPPEAVVPAAGGAPITLDTKAVTPAPVAVAAPEPDQFGALLQEAEQALKTDRKLAEAFSRAGNFMLPMVIQSLSEPQGNSDKPLPDYVLANSLTINARNADVLPMPAINPLYPIAILGRSVAGIGHLNSANDIDGAVRAEPLGSAHV
jgi:serine/threonine-protein kinase